MRLDLTGAAVEYAAYAVNSLKRSCNIEIIFKTMDGLDVTATLLDPVLYPLDFFSLEKNARRVRLDAEDIQVEKICTVVISVNNGEAYLTVNRITEGAYLDDYLTRLKGKDNDWKIWCDVIRRRMGQKTNITSVTNNIGSEIKTQQAKETSNNALYDLTGALVEKAVPKPTIVESHQNRNDASVTIKMFTYNRSASDKGFDGSILYYEYLCFLANYISSNFSMSQGRDWFLKTTVDLLNKHNPDSKWFSRHVSDAAKQSRFTLDMLGKPADSLMQYKTGDSWRLQLFFSFGFQAWEQGSGRDILEQKIPDFVKKYAPDIADVNIFSFVKNMGDRWFKGVMTPQEELLLVRAMCIGWCLPELKESLWFNSMLALCQEDDTPMSFWYRLLANVPLFFKPEGDVRKLVFEKDPEQFWVNDQTANFFLTPVIVRDTQQNKGYGLLPCSAVITDKTVIVQPVPNLGIVNSGSTSIMSAMYDAWKYTTVKLFNKVSVDMSTISGLHPAGFVPSVAGLGGAFSNYQYGISDVPALTDQIGHNVIYSDPWIEFIDTEPDEWLKYDVMKGENTGDNQSVNNEPQVGNDYDSIKRSVLQGATLGDLLKGTSVPANTRQRDDAKSSMIGSGVNANLEPVATDVQQVDNSWHLR